ncbi:MAG: hypothetical protein EPN21_00075, partial [Methylococcaceae bacterium]
KTRSAGNKRQSGGLFFGYFLLAAQKKVTRPWVREPTFKSLAEGAQRLFPVSTITNEATCWPGRRI